MQKKCYVKCYDNENDIKDDVVSTGLLIGSAMCSEKKSIAVKGNHCLSHDRSSWKNFPTALVTQSWKSQAVWIEFSDWMFLMNLFILSIPLICDKFAPYIKILADINDKNCTYLYEY